MAVSIKHKIRLGTVFLLLLLVLSGAISVYYQLHLVRASKNILKDNYISLDYCHEMQSLLDDSSGNAAVIRASFNEVLAKEEANITEPGEKQAVLLLRNAFNKWMAGDSSASHQRYMRSCIQQILALNMHAIERKNNLADSSAKTAFSVLVVVICLTLLLGLTFAYNFPAVVVEPIGKFMDAIKAISAKDFGHRIHLDNRDEFGRLAEAFNTMSERIEQFENSNLNKLIFEKARAEAVINSLKDASIGIDGNNKVLFANRQALQLLGLSKEDTVGRTVASIAEQNDLFRFLTGSENSAPFKVVLDGKENFYLREIVEVQQEGTTSKVIVMKNITSFKELDVAKNNFIATISHELKTPLASSDFSLKLLEDPRVSQLSPEQKEWVDQLKSDNQRMLRILSELLNLSQVEAGRIQLDIKTVSPQDIAQRSIQAVAVNARQKQVRIEARFDDNLPDVSADADKISWVLNNFFTNAIRYSPVESIVMLEVFRQGGMVCFAVKDYGPGIDEKYIGRLFERYFQVPGRSDHSGSGIGLAICKELVEAMGGTVSVESGMGEGSTFRFSLPAAENR